MKRKKEIYMNTYMYIHDNMGFLPSPNISIQLFPFIFIKSGQPSTSPATIRPTGQPTQVPTNLIYERLTLILFQRLTGISLSNFVSSPAILKTFLSAVSSTILLPPNTITINYLYGTGVKPSSQPSSTPSKQPTSRPSSEPSMPSSKPTKKTKRFLSEEIDINTREKSENKYNIRDMNHRIKFDIEGLSQANSVGLNYTISFVVQRSGFASFALARQTILGRLNSSIVAGTFNKLLQNSGIYIYMDL